jgi:hypothetical protein
MQCSYQPSSHENIFGILYMLRSIPFCLLDQNNLQDNKFLNKKNVEWLIFPLSPLSLLKNPLSLQHHKLLQFLLFIIVCRSSTISATVFIVYTRIYKNYYILLKSNSQKIHHCTWKLQKFAFHKLTSYKKFQNWKYVISLWQTFETDYYAVTPSKT